MWREVVFGHFISHSSPTFTCALGSSPNHVWYTRYGSLSFSLLGARDLAAGVPPTFLAARLFSNRVRTEDLGASQSPLASSAFVGCPKLTGGEDFAAGPDAPELVLVIFLPPLLYAAAFFTSLRDLRANVRPISLLAIGLVVITTLSVAEAAHWVIGFSWPVAFVLGAIVSPTDAVAPATIVRRLGVPRRVITIIEGENLTNDWTALVFYRFAVAAIVSGTFSLWEAGVRFLLMGLGGVDAYGSRTDDL